MPEKSPGNSDKEVRFFTPIPDTEQFSPVEMPDEKETELIAFLGEAQRKLIEQFPSDEEGLNLDRVNSFMDSLGLRIAPAVQLWSERSPALFEAISEATGLEESREQSGVYYAELDTAFVFRDRELEARNGSEFTESLLVHELAHGSSQHDSLRGVVRGSSISAVTPRLGQSVQPIDEGRKGVFIEEGFAEYVRGRYVTEVLGRTHGFADMPNEVSIATNPRDNFQVSVPSKYLHKTADGSPNVVTASYAGAAMDSLISRDPLLLPALVRARHDVDGLKEVAARIDAIDPGLYKKLRDDFNESDSFDDGLRHVSDALGLE